MIQTGTMVWLARHEARLVWRDWLATLQAGRRARRRLIVIGLIFFAALLHLVAYGVLKPYAAALQADKASLLVLTGSAFLAWTLMLSQAMESVTRAFYARADLDLILSSPASAPAIFAIRIGAIAVMTTVMAMLLVGPFINVMAALGGRQYLSAYGVLVAMGCAATTFSVFCTAVLFRLVGAKRTRLLAQIIAAVVGAGFVIGVQAAAIVSTGSLSRIAMFQSPAWIAAAPGMDSPVWWPALAAMGNSVAMAKLMISALCLLFITIALAAGGFAQNVTAAAGLSHASVSRPHRRVDFRPHSTAQALRRKEWMLLTRDPWLLSQSLMQVLYLLPPALLLWRNFGTDGGGLVVLAPVLVMAAGQLAGGLAWLAISGEDAPDLVATAPVTPFAMMRAKIEAVMVAVALPILPLVVGIALASPWIASVTIGGVGLAAAAATSVQLFFKRQAKRSQFRRRQTSSRIATFAEAFSSISIAGAAGLAAAGTWLALFPAAIALIVLIGAKALSGSSG